MMNRSLGFAAIGIFLFLLGGCSSQGKSLQPFREEEAKGEYIYRKHGEYLFNIEPPALVKRPLYPWEEKIRGNYTKITKDFFRCKGSSLHPVRFFQKGEEVQRFYDCGGPQRHSLPLKDQKEFIYPILLELLNYIQDKTGKRVVITCGHSCPEHNAYVNPSPVNQASKHQIGAEVDFYVQDLEQQPEKIVDLILVYYQEASKYKGLAEFKEFKRYEKTVMKTIPWYNKEIFIKLFTKDEGRDFDNRHPYPYISIQVRYDWDLQGKVEYTWERAFHNFHRW